MTAPTPGSVAGPPPAPGSTPGPTPAPVPAPPPNAERAVDDALSRLTGAAQDDLESILTAGEDLYRALTARLADLGS